MTRQGSETWGQAAERARKGVRVLTKGPAAADRLSTHFEILDWALGSDEAK